MDRSVGSDGSRLEEGMMRYRIQFLDCLDNVVREIRADARSAGTAFLRGASVVWPPHAMRVRVVDPSGHASVSKSWLVKVA